MANHRVRKGKKHPTRSNHKGYYKKKATFFQKGICNRFPAHSNTSDNVHVPVINDANHGETSNTHISDNTVQVSRPIVRHHADHLDNVVIRTHANELSTPGADGISGNAMILRPIQTTQDNPAETEAKQISYTGEYNMTEGNILVEKSIFLELFNSFTRQHIVRDIEADDKTKCKGIDIDIVDIRPWGLFSSVVLLCKSCGMRSTRTKLFKEVNTSKPGRKFAAGNLRLALMNQDMSIGPTELQLLFAAVGIRAGSMTNLQRNACKASDITERLTRRDMEKWLDVARDILRDRGVSNPDHLSAQFDVLYHSVNKANAHCPGQGAVQATGTCAETVTSSKKIIDFEHVCKVCLRGARLKGSGIPVICGHHSSKRHHDCTATIPRARVLREYDMARSIAQRLQNKEVAVTHLTTDSDAKGRDAFVDVNNKDPTIPPLQWYKDPSHLSRNMRKRISKHSIKGKMFGQKENGKDWTYSEKLECRKALALDVPRRVSLTLSNMRMYWKGDASKMKKNGDKIIEYMLKCYGGDHSSCKGTRLAKLTGCTGSTPGACWFSRSHTMRAQGISRLILADHKKAFLRSVIEMKLSPTALDYVARGETSSRCESTNRAINKSLPKNALFSRTSIGRVASAIGRVNNSFETFTRMKFTAMKCSLPENSPGDVLIRSYQRKRDLQAKYEKTRKAIKRKHAHIAQKSREYFEERTKETNEGDYHKFQLDNARAANTAAINAVLNAEPGTSTDYNKKLQQAQCTYEHMQDTLDTLDHAYTKTARVLAEKRKRKRAQTITKKRNTDRDPLSGC